MVYVFRMTRSQSKETDTGFSTRETKGKRTFLMPIEQGQTGSSLRVNVQDEIRDLLSRMGQNNKAGLTDA